MELDPVPVDWWYESEHPILDTRTDMEMREWERKREKKGGERGRLAKMPVVAIKAFASFVRLQLRDRERGEGKKKREKKAVEAVMAAGWRKCSP